MKCSQKTEANGTHPSLSLSHDKPEVQLPQLTRMESELLLALFLPHVPGNRSLLRLAMVTQPQDTAFLL